MKKIKFLFALSIGKIVCKLVNIIDKEKGTKDLQATVKIDAEVSAHDISLKTLQEIELLKPFFIEANSLIINSSSKRE